MERESTWSIEVTHPFAGKRLVLRGLSGREGLSQPFEYHLDLLCEDPELSHEDVLGRPIGVTLELPEGHKRYFHGLTAQFGSIGSERHETVYRAVLRPWLWFLTRTADCRIFQQRKSIEIIEGLCADHGFSDYEDRLSGSYETREYCVQYRESDFNFVNRLLEEEGIYYYFRHAQGAHTLVLSDSVSAHDEIAGYDEIEYLPQSDRSARERESVGEWLVSREVQPGTYVLKDFDFEQSKNSEQLLVRSQDPARHQLAKLEVYDYPGAYHKEGLGKRYAQVRREALQATHEVYSGRSDARGLAAGALFRLTEHPRSELNRDYLVTSTHLTVASDETFLGSSRDVMSWSFGCEFSAMDSQRSFRAPLSTPKAVVRGPQTATVVGPAGEEIHTDKYGRVKLQFHWDRDGKSDENSSCWVRVSQSWAGRRWGGLALPRIGQEVLVDFLEGDPDQPIVTGRVYNDQHMPPYALPEHKTRSTFKTRSSTKGDDDTFNELRFEDKKDEEEVYFHAERDFNRVVENDDTLKVGFEKQDPGDQTIDIYNHRTVTLEEGNDTLLVKTGNRNVTLNQGNLSLKVDQGNRSAVIAQGNDSLKVSVGNRSVKIPAGKHDLEAGTHIVLKVGGSQIKIDQMGITISAGKISIKGNMSADLGAPMTTVKGDGMLTLKGGIVKIN